MNLADYQVKASETAVYNRPKGLEWFYPVLNLGGEAGELQSKFSKVVRGDVKLWNILDDISDELGDVLWHVSQIATELGISLDDIALNNLAKLEDRKKRGKLMGSGDKR